MKILKNQKPTPLSNFEVAKCIESWKQSDLLFDQEIRPQKNQKNLSKPLQLKHSVDVKKIMSNTLSYIKNTEAYVASSYDNVKAIHQLCKEHFLTPAETLQVLNHRPKDDQMLILIIEDIDQRMTEQQQSEFLEKITELMPIHI